jgi:hypothetical protein
MVFDLSIMIRRPRCCYATAYEQIEEAMHRLERFMSRHG